MKKKKRLTELHWNYTAKCVQIMKLLHICLTPTGQEREKNYVINVHLVH